ncbi:hypothetical protein DFP72DRAFT_218555 [Ephemerocybe angulata]|uniref:Secreted protein n=1 Tax=Ephemerocybe angulata TaxID=980116 RepID=A0A8H6LV78_9AGAR|nr:hypothetical protein DFP72DRAFT_218555 [Tulosesus angulatus]
MAMLLTWTAGLCGTGATASNEGRGLDPRDDDTAPMISALSTLRNDNRPCGYAVAATSCRTGGRRTINGRSWRQQRQSVGEQKCPDIDP